MATATFDVKGKSRDEVIELLSQRDGAFFMLKEGKDSPVPHDGFIMGWIRTHADGRVQDLTGVSFDDVGVDYLDYLLGAFGPTYKDRYCHIWWRIWFYSTFERPDRWSMETGSFEHIEKSLKLSKEEKAVERSLEASLGDVVHWRKMKSPDFDDSDYDPSFDSGEELRDRIKRTRYGDIHQLRHRAFEGGSYIKRSYRPNVDTDPAPFITIGLDPKRNTTEHAQYALCEGARGYGESEDEWKPSLALRWIVVKNLEARGTKVYRYKPTDEEKERGVKVKLVAFVKKEKTELFEGSEWRPINGGDDFIRLDLYQWWNLTWNKLRSLLQVLHEERWETIERDSRKCWKIIRTQMIEVNRRLDEIVEDSIAQEKELLPEAFIAEMSGMTEAIQDTSRFLFDPEMQKIEEEENFDFDVLCMKFAERILKEWKTTPEQKKEIKRKNRTALHNRKLRKEK